MEIPEILSELAKPHDQFPRQVLTAAIRKKDEIIPHLLEILERAANDPEAASQSPGWDYGFALFLLAQFRETRAYPLAIKLASAPTDILDILLGDSITEDLHNLLASLCGGDPSLIQELIENPEADEYARAAAIESLLALVASNQMSRETVIDYFKTLFRGGLEKEPSFVWDGLVASATDLYPEEIYDDIKQAFAAGLANETVQDLEYIDHKITGGKEALLAHLPERFHLIDDAIAEMEDWRWAGDQTEPSPLERLDSLGWGEAFSAIRSEIPEMLNDWNDDEGADQMPYRAPKKIGRNEPCPCGSGKKYKKCCGAG